MNPAAVNTNVIALISKNFNDADVVINTDGSVVYHHQSYWAFITLAGGRTIQKVSGAFSVKLAECAWRS